MIVDQVDKHNFRSLRLFTQQIMNCSRTLLSLYQNAQRPEQISFQNFAANDQKEQTFPQNFMTG